MRLASATLTTAPAIGSPSAFTIRPFRTLASCAHPLPSMKAVATVSRILLNPVCMLFNFIGCIFIQLIVPTRVVFDIRFPYFSFRYRVEIHFLRKYPVLGNFTCIDKLSVFLGNLHSVDRTCQCFFRYIPATYVPCAMILKSEFDGTFLADEVTAVGNGLKIAAVCEFGSHPYTVAERLDGIQYVGT